MNSIIVMRNWAYKATLILCLMMAAGVTNAADRVADIRSTKHNLSATSSNAVKATTENEVCVFCHTPHAATAEPGAPLWNRTLDNQVYKNYSSSSLDAINYTDPDGKSKLCLSCHDGMVALGNVNVSNGGSSAAISMTTPNMPSDANETTGFTRRIGTDLSNDHPISFPYDDALADRDTELRRPSDVTHLGSTAGGAKPTLQLDENNKMQCTSCHDPHVAGTDVPTGTTLKPGVTDNIKFLRGKRFQMTPLVGSAYRENDDIVCLGCHEKSGTTWNNSVHAHNIDAAETYNDAAADLREFPRGIKVWQAGCLNCHDTHAVQGSRRLLREGVDGNKNTAGAKTGGKPAIEETCYQCHSSSAETILNPTGNKAPDIKTEFNRTYKMPITAYRNNEEKHDIGAKPTTDYPFSSIISSAGANFIESRENLGAGFGGINLQNRHAECTDCHNPHRQIKNERHDGSGGTGKATHNHAPIDPLNHNAAPGALKGTFGIEITAWNTIPSVWSGNGFDAFGNLPTISAIETRCGVNNFDCDGNPAVTKEYQVCLKCHSNFAYDDNGNPDGITNGRPNYTTALPASANRMLQYTNQAMEFYAPTSQIGERTGMADSGAHSRYVNPVDNKGNPIDSFNHRAWHPVMKETGRTLAIRNISSTSGPWMPPWNGYNVGRQTMMCSDCHNNGTNGKAEGSTTDIGGPHGSNNPKLLRGPWNFNVMGNDFNPDPIKDPNKGNPGNTPFCLDCHGEPYGGIGSNGKDSGFKHRHEGESRCHLCHIAIPHGWKNKSFLANLNDIGPEVKCLAVDADGIFPDITIPTGSDNQGGVCTPGQAMPKGSSLEWKEKYSGFIRPPYYNGAVLSVRVWEEAATWREESCGKNWGGKTGEGWMDICPSNK